MRGVHCERLWGGLRRQLLVVGHVQRARALLGCGAGMRVHGWLVGSELLSSMPGWGHLRGRIRDLVRRGDVPDRVWDAGPKRLLVMRGRQVLDRARGEIRGELYAMQGWHISVGAGRDECAPVRAVRGWDLPDWARHGRPGQLHALWGWDVSVWPRDALAIQVLAVRCGVVPVSAGGCVGVELHAVPARHVPDWIRGVVGSGLHAVQISVVSDGLRDGRRGDVRIVRGGDLPDRGGHEQRA